jgi:hypothetical protein
MNYLVLFLLTLTVAGCSTPDIKPWERGHLANAAMIFGSDSLVDATDDHIYFSKEGTSGGRSFAAGGCGCN